MPARDPPIGGLIDVSPEHSVRMGVRGGGGSPIRTSLLDLPLPEMGKILGKTRKLTPVSGRDAESPCATSVSHDSEVEK